MKALIAISFVALGSCMAQGPLVNGANLGMTVSGTSIIASGCVTGLSTQQFTVTTDGLVHARSST